MSNVPTSIRAKFLCTGVQDGLDWDDKSKKTSEQVFAMPVCGNGTENASFSSATPCGQLTLTITNPGAFGFFQNGKEFYLDFTPAQPDGQA